MGRIVKPFGIKGEIKLAPSEDFWEGVLDSKEIALRLNTEAGADIRLLELKCFRRHGSHYVLKAEGIEDRSAAESIVGGELCIETEKLDVALPEKALPFQIIGSTVLAEDGQHLGEVTSVMFTPAHDVYEIAGEERTFLVPAVPQFIISMDVQKREIVIRPIPGLMDG